MFFCVQDIRMPDVDPFGQSIQHHIPLRILSHLHLTFDPHQPAPLSLASKNQGDDAAAGTKVDSLFPCADRGKFA